MAIVRALFLYAVALMAVGLVAVTPLHAQTTTSTAELPSSSEVYKTAWLKMNPTTYAVSTASVLEQFDRVARSDSRLTPVMRDRLEAMVRTGEGIEVRVPDGIVLDYLTGRRDNKQHVYLAMLKKLGRDDRALLFTLGDGVSIYWFTGEKTSCNNIGVVFERILILEPVPVMTILPPKKPQYKMQGVTKYTTNVNAVYLPAFMLAGCSPCCPPQYYPSLFIQNASTDKSSTFTMVLSGQ